MPTEIHAFDLDDTLLKGNGAFQFGRYLYRQKYFSTFTMLQLVSAYAFHKLGLISITTLHNYNFRKIFQNQTVHLLHQYAQQFAATVILYPPALQALTIAQSQNHHILILSSSPDFLVMPIAQKLGVTKTFATHYEIDKDHRFCKISVIFLGNMKAQTVIQYAKDHHVPQDKLTAYSDSHLDLPFLKAAGNPVGVNPNKQLRKICAKQNWPII